MKHKICIVLFCILILICIEGGQEILLRRSRASILNTKTCATEAFREQRLLPGLYQQLKKQEPGTADWIENLTAVMLNGGFYPESCSFDKEPYLRYKYREYKDLCDAYRMVWNDAEYFPVASKEIFFEDNWLKSGKNDGKDQKRAGCDLFGKYDQADFYPIISMTDGRIEEIGWIPSDGYRIGIRAPSGGYFYYAHLSSYERLREKGTLVEAGEILGFMGNTGCDPGKAEGKIPVHLNFRIYIRTPCTDAMSVNPYWVLRAVQKKIINCVY